MTENVVVLEMQGFEPVTTDLPGAWATDGDWTVAVLTRPIHGGPVAERCHRVLVYEGSSRNVDVDSSVAAEATDTSIESATRTALLRAGYPVPSDAGQ